MSDTDTTANPVSDAFDTLTRALRDSFTADDDLDPTVFARNLEYFKAVGPLAKNWKAGLPVSGNVPSKRGRKPGSTNANAAAAATSEAGGEAATAETGEQRPTRGRKPAEAA